MAPGVVPGKVPGAMCGTYHYTQGQALEDILEKAIKIKEKHACCNRCQVARQRDILEHYQVA